VSKNSNVKKTSPVKRIEIEHLTESYSKILPSSVTIRISTEKMNDAIEKNFRNNFRITKGEIIIYFLGKALKKYPEFNSYYSGDGLFCTKT